ncbi:MAG: hypothetical protein QOJ65_1047, partial [Fimbriimonadaceae bacterium]|nr:hypothetical protein [Fimbriimonadaceae bacterium]
MRLPGVLAMVVLGGLAHGQADAGTEALLEKMRKAYASIASARINTTCRFFHGRKSLDAVSVVEFANPMFVRVQTKGVPGLTKPSFLAVTDGKQAYLDGLPDGSVTLPYDSDKFSRYLPQLNLEVLCLWDWKRQLSTAPKGFMFRSTFKT